MLEYQNRITGYTKFHNSQAMIAMDQTIAGAASGETAEIPRRRRVHNLRQKDRRVRNIFVMLITISRAKYYFDILMN